MPRAPQLRDLAASPPVPLPLLLARGFEPEFYGPAKPRTRVDQALAADGGTAVIPIIGALVRHQDWRRGYDCIAAEFTEALALTAVPEIILWLDSPGGEAAGAFDLADLIFEARGTKPITAIVDDRALSAAYLLASAADRVLVTRTGSVGSIGCLTSHLDVSGALKRAGLKVTEIAAGAHKRDFSPFAPLSDGARAAAEAEVTRLAALFTETVARNRGLPAKAVRDQEAATFHGEIGVAAGLADDVFAFHKPKGKAR
jgi:ClpP class serine protease